MITTKWMGLGSTMAKLDVISKGSFGKVKKAVDNVAQAIEQDARSNAAVLTGELLESVDHEVEKESSNIYMVKVGPSDSLRQSKQGKPYSIFNEYGTSNMAAQPFLRPACDAHEGELKKELKDIDFG